MIAQRQLPEFVTAGWYSDPSDHRCPHDAWLETLEVQELADGERKERRKTAITVRLLGAYHDGHIVFRYAGVKRYEIGSSCAHGLGDWIRDAIVVSADGFLSHQITWCFGPDAKSAWLIEAEEVSYEWLPKNG